MRHLIAMEKNDPRAQINEGPAHHAGCEAYLLRATNERWNLFLGSDVGSGEFRARGWVI